MPTRRSREQMTRLAARRAGLELRKVMATGPRADQSASTRWRILDLDRGLVLGGRAGLDLDQVEAIVLGDRLTHDDATASA